MSNLGALSHSISAETAMNLKDGKNNSPKGSPKKIHINEEMMMPPKQKKENVKEIKEIQKKYEEKNSEKEKGELLRKIEQYSDNPRLREYFPQSLLDTKTSPNDSLEKIQGVYKRYASCLKQAHKKMFFSVMFDQVCTGSEMLMVQGLQMSQKRGIGGFLQANKDTVLQPELDELVIELSDDYLPGPGVRAVMKFAQLLMMYDVEKHSNPYQEKEENNLKSSNEDTVSVENEQQQTKPSSKRFPAKVSNKRK